ncbi:MAG TPA: hypothetical protein VHZ04_01705 [Candidatus Paceibacterota bacterium]|jgi:hypothetical protein|nr:hypothetical protein [Candidatus Paceibacterota bacterium]
MSHIKKYFYRFGSAIGMALSISISAIAYAQSNGIQTAPTTIITNTTSVVNLFCAGLDWLFWGLIVLGVAMFLIGGYTYATAAGDSEKVSKATRTLTYAAIAIVVGLVARGVPTLIGSFFGQSSNLNVCSS